ncbi:hypothetical protein [Methylorubrum suomiense]|uniref:Uncharacterized protein n=1 Tax=Methylorubrum suomiense TaxID=144191 RepID=A0ABQ4V0Z7_9HYPH|nr:hypothetical protein [Methylorubrum suomiense]GJE78066.1 hypothetical protein BGCPKDLD_4677 [Methylorubrum suomiense]
MTAIELSPRLGRILERALRRAPRCTHRYAWPEAVRLGHEFGVGFCARWRGQRVLFAYAEFC